MCELFWGRSAAQQALSVSSKLAIHLFYWENDKYESAERNSIKQASAAALFGLIIQSCSGSKNGRVFVFALAICSCRRVPPTKDEKCVSGQVSHCGDGAPIFTFASLFS
jgi:hypothetical protein